MNALRSDLPPTGDTTMSGEAIASSYHGKGPAAVEHEVAIGLAARAVFAQGAQFDADPPARVLALDVNQMVARAAVLAIRRRRRRGDADHGHWPVGTGDARHLASVIVAMQHELTADAADHRLEGGSVCQALEAALGGERRMMDQHDP